MTPTISKETVAQNKTLIQLLDLLYGKVQNHKWLPRYVFTICKNPNGKYDYELLKGIAEELGIKNKDLNNKTVSPMRFCDMIQEHIGYVNIVNLTKLKIDNMIANALSNINSSLYLSNTLQWFHILFDIPVFRMALFKEDIEIEEILQIIQSYEYKDADFVELLINIIPVLSQSSTNLRRAAASNAKGFNVSKLGSGINPSFWYACKYTDRQRIVALELAEKFQKIIKTFKKLVDKLLLNENTQKWMRAKEENVQKYKGLDLVNKRKESSKLNILYSLSYIWNCMKTISKLQSAAKRIMLYL
jgi:hypothetical protein